MGVYALCPVKELPPGSRRVFHVNKRRIAVFNVGGRYYAIRDVCPHQGASLCRGTLGGAMLPSAPHEYVYGLEDQVVRCPWHGWAFHLADGRSLFAPQRVRVRTYPVRVEDGWVKIEA